ncbi:MAG: hypothetical protein V3T47_00530 [Gammaproteobacteria bacterium]
MNTTEPKNALRGADQVSRAYRAANFDEEPPAELEREILAAARRHRRRPLASYLPPLALAATVVISISLVFRSGELNENAEILSDEAPPAAEFRAVPISTVRELEEAVAPVIELEAAVAPVEAAARREGISQDQQAVRPDAFEVLPLTAGTGSAVEIGCANVDRGQPDTWLACISVRLQQGYEGDARRELEAFAQAYPDYSLAEDLEALRVP